MATKAKGKARSTRRGGRKGSPVGGRGFKTGARGARDTPQSRAEGGREVSQESTEARSDVASRARRGRPQ